MSRSTASRQVIVLPLFVLLALGSGAASRGDVLTLVDGRTFEGTLSAEKNGSVQFDTVVSGIRARLTFDKASIKSVEKKALPESMPAGVESDPNVAEPGSPSSAPTLYLEVPIKGRFKEQVFVQPIRSTLAYAKLHGVKHVVFTVDSTGGAVDEAGAIYRAMRDFENAVTYHAIITNCTGEAVVVPFLCQTIHLQPGATVGGLSQKLENLPGKFAKKDEDVVRAQLADDLAEIAQQRGRKGDIIRALIDPSVTLAAWIDEKGETQLDKSAPAGLPADRLIFADGPDQVLALSYEQATRLGVPSVKGGVAALGALLGFTNWTEESSYGRDTMNRAIAAKKRRQSTAQAKFEDAVARNIRMRDMTSRAIQGNLKQAASWNPTDASYTKLYQHWNPLWNSESQWDGHLWTPESRRRWQSRSDACSYFLGKAKSGLEAMLRLDKEAISLGLSPTFKEGELQSMLDDVNVKLAALARGRNRTGE